MTLEGLILDPPGGVTASTIKLRLYLVIRLQLQVIEFLSYRVIYSDRYNISIWRLVRAVEDTSVISLNHSLRSCDPALPRKGRET